MTILRLSKLARVASSVVLAAASQPAHASAPGTAAARNAPPASDTPSQPRVKGPSTTGTLTVMGKLGFLYTGGYGAALRYRHTVAPRGFIQHARFHDEFGIEGGIDYTRYDIDLDVASWNLDLLEFSAAATWNFWFTERFAAYPRAGLGFGVASFSNQDGLPTPVGYGGVYGVGGAGVLFALDVLTLRAEINNRELSVGGALTF